MKTIFITGASGFVGTNLQAYLKDKFQFSFYRRGEMAAINADIVIHLAGKAHDTSAHIFITLSSVKAVADKVKTILREDIIPTPASHYGKSKLLAEEYILSKPIPTGKRVYILRPCMIHGPANKGNLNLLYQMVRKNLPWPLASFNNKRSFCGIENLCFVIKELINNEDIKSGIYNMADDESISTNDLVLKIATTMSLKPRFLYLPVKMVKYLAMLGDIFPLFPLNSERLEKLTESYVVDNKKIKAAIGKPFPKSLEEGISSTFYSLHNLSRQND